MAISKVVVVDGNNLTVRIDRGVAGRGVTDVEPVEIDNQLYLEFTFSDGTTETVGPVGTIQYIGESPIVIDGPTISLTTVPVTLGGTNATTAAGARTNLNAANQDTTISAGTGLSGGGSLAANRTISIANTAVTAGSYGAASKTLTATVNAQGQLTALADTPIAIANTQISGLGTMSTQNANAVAITGGSITGITDLAIADGGTGASTAADARTNLGLGTAAVLNAGVANGVATLDAGGTVPLSQIPASIQGGVSYQGSWNAATNTPTIVSSVGTKGHYYVVSVAGSTNINGITDWLPGDWIIFNGSVWEQIDNTDTVQSVNGYVGAVVLNAADVGAPPTTRTITAGTGLSGGGDLSANRTIDIANTAVSAGSYGTASSVPSITVNAQGQLTAASNTTIAIANTQVSGLGTMSTQNANAVAITGGTATLTSLTVNDNTTLGSSNTDTTTFNGRIASEFTPSTANTYDLGRNSHEWRNLYLTGTANISALSASGAVTLSGGTANGVAYLNGSKVLTTGSALTFDGTNLSTTGRVIVSGSAGTSDISLGAYSGGAWLNTPSATAGYLAVGGSNAFRWDASNLVGYIGGSEQMRLTSTGLGIGTSSPSVKLDVAGGAKLTGTVVTTTGSDAFSAGSGTGTSIRVNALFKGTDASGNARTSYIGTNIYGTDGSMEFGNNVAGLTMSIAPGGNVGIGTSSPQGKLSVSNGTIFVGSESNTTQTNNLLNGYGYRIGTTLYGNVSVRSTYSQVTNAASLEFYVGSSGTTTAEAMRITSAGNLGIGTSSPAAKLDVQTSGVGIQLKQNATGSATYYVMDNTVETGGKRWRFGYTGAAGIPTFSLYNQTDNVLAWASDASGNLGIGTSSPFSNASYNSLTVGGSKRGILTLNNASGTNVCQMFVDSADVSNLYSTTSIVLGSASGANLLTLDSSGNLGLGVTPSAWQAALGKVIQLGTGASLVGDSGAPRLRSVANAYFDGSNWRYIADGYATYMYQNGSTGETSWQQAPSGTAGNAISFTQAMTLDASGRLLIGGTSTYDFNGQANLVVNGTANNATITIASTDIGYLAFADGTGGTDRYTGSIQYLHSSNAMLFSTNGGAERARIDSSGNLLVGTTSSGALSGSGLVLGGNGIIRQGIVSPLTVFTYFYYAGTQVGSISTTGAATAYNTSSDYRLKNITGPITTSGAYIDSLNPVEGTWKADGSAFVGLIAHEVQEASRTQVATGVKDGEEMQGMDYSSAEIIANLIAEVQSLRARVAALEAE